MNVQHKESHDWYATTCNLKKDTSEKGHLKDDSSGKEN